MILVRLRALQRLRDSHAVSFGRTMMVLMCDLSISVVLNQIT